MSAHRAFPVVVAAPSGTGKTTVCRGVVEHDDRIVFSVSHTTRLPREGERDGIDYHFVDESAFRRMAAAQAFLESAHYNEHHYGTSWAAIDGALDAGRDVLLEIEVQGARQVRARRDDARLVFLLPPSLRALRARLEGRGTDTEERIEERLQLARTELEAILAFDYAVVNDDLERCVAQLLDILEAERRGDTTALREQLAPAPALTRLRAAG